MRALFLTVLAVSAVASVVVARPGPHNAATLCLDGLGINHAPICHEMSASRFPQVPDICQCRGPYRQVEAPYCARGERPPADSADFDRARARAAQDGSLFGDTYHGRSMCVSLRGD